MRGYFVVIIKPLVIKKVICPKGFAGVILKGGKYPMDGQKGK